jgi:hypothetical protein
VSSVCLVPALPAAAIGAFLCAGAAASLGYLVHTKAHQQWRRNKLSRLDWIWFIGMPIAIYVLLLLSGIGLLLQAIWPIYGVAISLILLLVTGIRNAWDLVIWISRKEREK